ncbi:site-specific DNA-methyltransferase [Tumebacillus permanentifrigoris]|uniref:Adenine-specific DNA-methyltransferase n=1 Tax=Tumebacillus permanentifrigoris TaxID=378543 RepID=A0A316D906_9BACL|nr:site-specific DNA-methyltransferase [Tumebacillus permanentifrigoris]PWK13107.1 adenine-specific DNA-methyltransferase [Tumebacillus permanentifrigoris]
MTFRSPEQITEAELRDFYTQLKKSGGIVLQYHGKWSLQHNQRRVRPRVPMLVRDLCFGAVEEQANHLLVEGENLQAMTSLYNYRGKIDLIVTDPPYNTGQFFRYNDKWAVDPNDLSPGRLVAKDDGSRHTKWLSAITVRLHLMRNMLKPNGVLAICIDENELFHLGMLLNEVFGSQNRIAIINWQKSYSPKNDSKHVSTATEYVLVYARDKERARTDVLSRSRAMNAKYKNPDHDPAGAWKSNGDPTVATPTPRDRYAIQSPFTGALHYPGARAWSHPKKKMKAWLQAWGSSYEERDLGDGRAKALVLCAAVTPAIPADINLDNQPVVQSDAVCVHPAIVEARSRAEQVREEQVWPMLYFSANGQGRPALKRYLNQVKQGKITTTYWADEDYEEPLVLGTQSWGHEESGHSQTGINELDAILGKGHHFQTVKPLKLIKKLIHLWCPPKGGIVLDPYAGSGTTAHAVLELNAEAGADRRFVLIEQGNPDSGDFYARSLTRERIRRAITGERPDADGKLVQGAPPLRGGFRYLELGPVVDAEAVLAMSRDELIGVILASSTDLIPVEDGTHRYLFARDPQGKGYFLITGEDGHIANLDVSVHKALRAELGDPAQPLHVFARFESVRADNVEFYKVPDAILQQMGFEEAQDSYFNEDGEV